MLNQFALTAVRPRREGEVRVTVSAVRADGFGVQNRPGLRPQQVDLEELLQDRVVRAKIRRIRERPLLNHPRKNAVPKIGL